MPSPARTELEIEANGCTNTHLNRVQAASDYPYLYPKVRSKDGSGSEVDVEGPGDST